MYKEVIIVYWKLNHFLNLGKACQLKRPGSGRSLISMSTMRFGCKNHMVYGKYNQLNLQT